MKNLSRLFIAAVALIVVQSSFAMQIPQRECPDLSVSNNSDEVVTGWLYKQNLQDIRQSSIQVFTLMPKQPTKPNPVHRQVSAILAAIHTKTQRYTVQAVEDRLELLLLGTPKTSNNALWKETIYKIQEIPFDSIAQLASVLVKADGKATLFTPGYKPQDGRPDVQLAAYKELTGHESYGTPEFILGLEHDYKRETVVQAYQKFLKRWEFYYSKSEFAADIFNLVLWAKMKLDLEKS